MKSIIAEIHKNQLKSFCSLHDFLKHKPLSTKRRGLYWLWTNSDFSELKNAHAKEETQEVPISVLVLQREALNNISRIEKDGFKIVYNGKGGYIKSPPAFGLRERINQEINCNDYRTGTLNIKRRFNLENWAVSFFDFDDPANASILNLLKTNNPYTEFAKDIEMLWRLEYGTPILCRH